MFCLPSTLTESEQNVFTKTERKNESHNTAAKYSLLIPNKTEWRPLDRNDMSSMKYFVFFIGWPRSCHSIVGSILDAHPNVIIAHEFYLFTQLSKHKELLSNRSRLYNELYRNSYVSAAKGWRTSKKTQKGYSLDVGSWQGRFTKLEVIGDKCGGDAPRMYAWNKEKFKTLYQQLSVNVKVPIKVLHIVRNPFDMIATTALYIGSGIPEVKYNATVAKKYSNRRVLRGAADSVLHVAKAISEMIPDLELSSLEIHCDNLITHPTETIYDLCRFLNLECSPDYVQTCADKIFRNVSATRHLVEWNPDTLPLLINRTKTFPFFSRYSLD